MAAFDYARAVHCDFAKRPDPGQEIATGWRQLPQLLGVCDIARAQEERAQVRNQGEPNPSPSKGQVAFDPERYTRGREL
jgi:hypothetical protein